MSDIAKCDLIKAALAQKSHFIGSPTEVVTFIRSHSHGYVRDNLSSIFIDLEGAVYLLRPHTHACIAQNTLNDVFCKHDTPSAQSVRDLAVQSGGIIRAQYYSDGLGVSVRLQQPPNESQLAAIVALFDLTTKERFVAELVIDIDIVNRVTSIVDMLAAISTDCVVDAPLDDPSESE
jgi:hypothetical protein